MAAKAHFDRCPGANKDDSRPYIIITVEQDETITCFPHGDGERIAACLPVLLKAFTDSPERIRCAAGVCQNHLH